MRTSTELSGGILKSEKRRKIWEQMKKAQSFQGGNGAIPKGEQAETRINAMKGD